MSSGEAGVEWGVGGGGGVGAGGCGHALAAYSLNTSKYKLGVGTAFKYSLNTKKMRARSV